MKEFTLFWAVLFLISPSALAVPAQGHKIMITAPSPRAVEVGQKVAKKGGNVADVAVAVELALAVTSPYYASLGGGGFAMIKMGADPVKALDFREAAPILTHPTFYRDKPEHASTIGPLAVAIPGIAAGMWEVHHKYGKLKWAALFEEPIRLAEQGFPVSGDWVRITEDSKLDFNSAGKKYFFKREATPYLPGEILVQPQLGKALRLLRDQGPKAFYQGAIAKDLATTMKKLGGVLAHDDLKNYKVRWLTPMQKNYLGYTINMMPPPSSSGVITASLISLAEMIQLNKDVPTSTEEYNHLAEMMKISYRGRSLLGDPDFHKNPIAYLTSDAYLKPLAKKISTSKPMTLIPLNENVIKKESNETTNFTVMDANGNTIVMTVTLNGNYGSRVVTNTYGIALNNEMDDFTTDPEKPNMFGLIQGKGNLVQAGKRPLSSMSPTIVQKDNKTVLALGASGGPRIISSVFQTWYRVLANSYNIDRAIQTPRLHQQFAPETLYVDELNFSADTKKNLINIGHKVNSSWMGRVNGIYLNDKGILEGAFDSRVEGGAGGI
jgi:gamma-glutamyltranspeptidase / glutathione hydrolase